MYVLYVVCCMYMYNMYSYTIRIILHNVLLPDYASRMFRNLYYIVLWFMSILS